MARLSVSDGSISPDIFVWMEVGKEMEALWWRFGELFTDTGMHRMFNSVNYVISII